MSLDWAVNELSNTDGGVNALATPYNNVPLCGDFAAQVLGRGGDRQSHAARALPSPRGDCQPPNA